MGCNVLEEKHAQVCWEKHIGGLNWERSWAVFKTTQTIFLFEFIYFILNLNLFEKDLDVKLYDFLDSETRILSFSTLAWFRFNSLQKFVYAHNVITKYWKLLLTLFQKLTRSWHKNVQFCIEFVMHKNKRLAFAIKRQTSINITQSSAANQNHSCTLQMSSNVINSKNVNYSSIWFPQNHSSILNTAEEKANKTKSEKDFYEHFKKRNGSARYTQHTGFFCGVSLFLPSLLCWYHERFSFISLCVSFSRKRIS